MTEEKKVAATQAEKPANGPVMSLQKIYVKDVSFVRNTLVTPFNEIITLFFVKFDPNVNGSEIFVFAILGNRFAFLVISKIHLHAIV